MAHILVICTGNICRSPIAAALLRQRLEQEGLADWTVESAGTWPMDGARVSLPAAQVMRDRGFYLEDHRAREVTREMLEKADLVLVMTQNHSESLRQEFYSEADKVFLLSEMKDGRRRDVKDPYGRSVEMYQDCVNDIADLIESGFDRIRSLAEGNTV
jgi:protein-tyrosine phosphatase